MPRFAILNSVDPSLCESIGRGAVNSDDAVERLTGCVWLFAVHERVRDTKEAARQAVRDHFASEEGKYALGAEGRAGLTWEEAIRWVDDEIWSRHGLTPIRHPDVERVLLSADESPLEAELEEPPLA